MEKCRGLNWQFLPFTSATVRGSVAEVLEKRIKATDYNLGKLFVLFFQEKRTKIG
jgi:hypothetical protein